MKSNEELSPFTRRVIQVIQAIPPGRISTYGGIAVMAGSPRAARQVVRILNSMTRAYNLPWYRVLGADGRIRLPRGGGFEEQEAELLAEGIEVIQGRVDLTDYLWRPDSRSMTPGQDR